MKSKLHLVVIFFGILNASAQTTHDLNWAMGMGTNVDLTIESGDTVIWTWTSPNHTVENVPGSSVETFNSGFLAPVGSTFSYTFTVVGENDYFCGFHGAAMMSGTITVEENLGIGEESTFSFKIHENPADNNLTIELPQHIHSGKLSISDMLGKQIKNMDFNQDEILQVKISDLNQGLYFVTIESEGHKSTKRFVKK
ncbi:MAG TPA: T9SS type A sorting domain-containing protein [Aquaticitalea sp.]|nr:T9SS type A sorting domain-containing protein [Aquaticitalea sp.]